MNRWTDRVNERPRWGGKKKKKSSSFLLFLFPDKFQDQKQRGREESPEVFIRHLGQLKNKVQLPMGGLPGVFKAAACPNLEDNIVYSWWKDKPARPAPPPMEAEWALPVNKDRVPYSNKHLVLIRGYSGAVQVLLK